tara:strand:+ start:524 stop:700 length:177 start_codon:yes stop_codon:yes gene_type:complete
MPKYEIIDVIMADGTRRWAVLSHLKSVPKMIYHADSKEECQEAMKIIALKSIDWDCFN